MNKLFFFLICMGLMGINSHFAAGQQAGENANVTEIERLLGSWETINQLISEAEQSYNSLASASTVDQKALEDFQQTIGGNGLLMAYYFFTRALRDKNLMDKHDRLVQFVTSQDSIQAEAFEAIRQIYLEIKKFNEEWQTDFPTKEAVLKKWEDLKSSG